jgi:NADH pyrophosphatase NudC (nudix superfamily)
MAEAPQVVKDELQQILDEEAFMILHSGETPEIAYHSSLHYLFEDQDGPCLKPGALDLTPLKKAVFQRYEKILFRDMTPAYRDKRIYRGLARSIANWHRLKNFCAREGFDLEQTRKEAARRLLNFLNNEAEEISSGKRKTSSINCTWKELKQFAAELGIDPSDLDQGLEHLCSRK